MTCERCNSGSCDLIYFDSFDCKTRVCSNCFEKLTGAKIKEKKIPYDMFLNKFSKKEIKQFLEDSLVD